MFAATVLLVAATASGAWAALPLPEYVRPCSIMLSDRKLSECAFERSHEIMPKIMKGDPKYLIPVLDPLHIDRMDVINGNGPLGLQLISSDIQLHGLSKIVINSITHISKPKIVDTYVVTVPEITANSKYNVSGRVLLLPIVGEGNAVLKFKNVKLTYQMGVQIEKRPDGEFYYAPLPEALLDVEVDGMSVQLDNLFNGDKALVETTNMFINNEWKEVFESLKPSFAKEIAVIVGDILQNIFSQVAMKNVFLEFDEFMKTDRFQPVDKSGG